MQQPPTASRLRRDHEERPHLTVLLGAGFAQSLGLPGTQEITRSVRAAFDATPDADVAKALDERLGVINGGLQTFETVGAALEAAMLFADAGPIEGEAHYETISRAVSVLHEGLTPEVAQRLYAVLMRTVAEQVDVSADQIMAAPNFGELASFFDALRENFELNVSTLNYDRCVETVLGEGSDGFGGEEPSLPFTSRALLANRRTTIAHLHGAVSWRMLQDGAMMMGKGAERSTERWTMQPHLVPYGSMITGGSKAEKLAIPPYSVYNWWFGKCLLDSPRLLVIGYGGGDEHINAWLVNYGRHHEGQAKTVIVDRCDGRMPGSLIRVALLADGASMEIYRDYLDERVDPVRIGSVRVYRGGAPVDSVTSVLHDLGVARAEASAALLPFATFVGLVQAFLNIETSAVAQPENAESFVRWRFAEGACTLWNCGTVADLAVAPAGGLGWRAQYRLDARSVESLVAVLRPFT